MIIADSTDDRDLLLGAKVIQQFVNSLLDPSCQVTQSQVYRWIEEGYLPARRIGARIVGSKAALRRYLTSVEG